MLTMSVWVGFLGHGERHPPGERAQIPEICIHDKGHGGVMTAPCAGWRRLVSRAPDAL